MSVDNSLYDDGTIAISMARDPSEHYLKVGRLGCYLHRGVLKALSEGDSERLRRGLTPRSLDLLYILEEQKLSLESLGWALAKARIKELEREARHFAARSR